MHATTTTICAAPVRRTGVSRWADALRAATAAFAARRRRAAEFDAIAKLDPLTLKDIGAPDELRAHAAARQAAAYERFEGLLR